MSLLANLPSDVVLYISASISLAVGGGVVVWAGKHLKGLTRMTRDWNGEPAREGISDGKPGVMQRLYSQDRKFEEVMNHLGRQDTTLEEIRHEINFNSGLSIKDKVDRTDKAMTSLQQDVTAIKHVLESK